MGVQILHYYLKKFSIIIFILIFIFIFYFYYTLNKNIFFNEKIINITKGSNIEKVISENIEEKNFIDINIYKLFYFILAAIDKDKIIHYGNFKTKKNQSFISFIELISKPSNILNKITIVEGWSKNKLNEELSKFFEDFRAIEYDEILADTYFFHQNQDFGSFLNNIKKYKVNYLKNKKQELNYNYYTNEEIMIIGSLIEREGLDYDDKLKISSVIFNRLNKNMKLQIDATVVYVVTDGKNNLNRNLNYSDLKIINPYNTYVFKGLPPKPISYVGTKTIDIILERYKSDFLFYFFDNIIKKHIFSENYDQHRTKLNEYRDNK